MADKQLKRAAGIVVVFLVGLGILQGCGQISGDFNANQPPLVELVNVPQDASDSTTTQHNGMPFNALPGQPVVILSMQGAVMLENSETVYLQNPGNPLVSGTDYTMDYAAGTLTALTSGSMIADTTYFIDFSFRIANYYVFSYAPTIHWVGYDPDGFVDHYRYADVTDSAFIAGFRAAANPQSYVAQNQSQLVWYDTTAMEARIYLLTTEGDTTEHLFFVKAVDNLGSESQNLAYKTFFRSNNAPANPSIKPLENPDTDFIQHFVVQDTLFCLDNLTPNWQGISFNWKSSDPDDKELYQIPLEFSYYLVKTPGDTIWAVSDSSWSETKQIQLFGLETGSYTFSVWVRDDAYTLSAEPATVSFKVVRPTFQFHLLVVDETINQGIFEASGDSIANFWYDLLSNLEGQLDYDNYLMDGVDVRFLDNSNTNNMVISPIPYSLIGQYKLVLIYDDDHVQITSADYIENRNRVLSDYLDIGGRVWIEGRRVLTGSYGYSNGPINISSSDFMGAYMQLETAFGTNRQAPGQLSEFIGAISVFEGMPDLQVDTNRVNLINDPGTTDPRLLMEVDWFTRSDEAVSLYTFNSVTADTIATSPLVYGEDSEVESGSNPVQCIVLPTHTPVLGIYRVENITKGVMGQVSNFNTTQIMVTYPYGEPWTDTDVLEVDYRYDPVSEMHLKPVAIRYENQPRVTQTIEIQGQSYTYYTTTLGYRTSIFTFPLFFMQNEAGQAEVVARDMLNWFFYPTIHWAI